VDHTVRTLAGLEGAKDLIWLTEDLQASPMLDVYLAFFQKFSNYQQQLGLEHPEVWAQEENLVDSFTQLTTMASAAGVSLHVVDVSNRDRRSADMAMDVRDTAMFAAGTPSGERTSVGQELASSGTSTGSARAMAEATGGSFFAGSRDYGAHLSRLSARFGSYYEISYQIPGPPSGQLHPVVVSLLGRKGVVRYPRMVGHRTPLQKLADKTLTRLHLGVGDNSLETRVLLGDTEAGDEETVIRTVHVDLAVDDLKLEKQEDTMVGSLVLVFQSLDASGVALPPQVLQQPVSVAADRLGKTSMVRTSARLKTAKTAKRLAVGAFDQLSGHEGTAVAEISSGG
jgi:hypothetical protein